MTTLKEIIEEVQGLIEADCADRALDVLYDKMYDEHIPQSALAHTMLAKGGFAVGGDQENFVEVDEVFKTLPVEKYDILVGMGLLTTTCQCKEKFSNRSAFVERIKKAFPEHILALKGLE